MNIHPIRLVAMLIGIGALHAAAKPNIVVIVSDDCGYNEFSLHGTKLYPTPRIDSIAANGVNFTNGYVSGSVCSPSRAGLLTGRYQERFGHEHNIPPVYSEANGLALAETLLPQVLKPAGYRTIALGKWHLGYAPKFHPLTRGFDDYYGFLQGQRSYFPLQKTNRLNALLRDREPVKEEFTSLDIFPTAMAAAGVDKSSGKPLDGVNLIPYLTGKTEVRPHQTLFWKAGATGAVRDGDLKLVLGYQKNGAPELFDLAKDKAETTNIAAERAADAQRLQHLFSDWKNDFPAPLWGPGAEPAESMSTD